MGSRFAVTATFHLSANLSRNELEAEKGNVRAELTNYLNDHHRILWPRIQQLLGEDVLTFRQALTTIPNVTLADVREHHRRTHTTRNMRFVIAGKLQGRKAAIRREIEQFELQEGERFEIPDDELVRAGAARIRRKDATNLTFGWSMVVPRVLNDEELDALQYLNHILTGTMHSRIFGKARSKGLAYHVGSFSSVRRYDSSWDITGQVNHDTASKLFTIMHDEMRAVLDGKISASELEAAKSYAMGRYQMGAQTVGQISGFYTGRYFADGSIKDYYDVPNRIKNVQCEQMQTIAQEFIANNIWVLAAVSSGETSEIERLHEQLAPLFPAT